MDWKLDWDLAIKRNSEALKGIIAALFAMLGDATVSRIPRPVHSAVLRVLRPAESAVRRLIVIAARGLVVKVAPSRPMPKGQMIGKGGGNRLPSFQLCDTRNIFPGAAPAPRKIRETSATYPFFGDDSRIDDLWPVPRLPLSAAAVLMALSMRNASAAGSRPSSWR